VRVGAVTQPALVTGVAADGRSVDLSPLREFVRELYVADDRARETYARSEDVCAVKAEYVARQDGWVVLDVDVEAARVAFAAADSGGGGGVVVEAVAAPARAPLDEDALRRDRGFGFTRPTRGQAVVGGLACAPLAGLFYAGWTGAKDGLGDGEAVAGFGRLILAAGGVGTGGCLVLGAALLLYAASLRED
jgi:hypothetical protein